MENKIEKLLKSDVPLTSSVSKDEFISASEKAFDCIFDGTSRFYPWQMPILPETFKLGVIIGSSGSGKSTLLKELGEEEYPEWLTDKSIISHFASADEAINKMGAVGLNSIPSWYKSFDVLSNGEKFRANLARKIKSHAVIDEFTSVVDRNVAKAASVSLSRYITEHDVTNMVLATCHRDILEWLEPDWVLDTDAGLFYQGFFLPVPKLKSMFTVPAMISGPCLKTIII